MFAELQKMLLIVSLSYKKFLKKERETYARCLGGFFKSSSKIKNRH